MALALLRDASVDGRLTIEELAESAEHVSTARTRDEVAAATADLAAPSPPLSEDVARCAPCSRPSSARQWAERLSQPPD